MHQSRSNILAIFDFDKTLISEDSFRIFSLQMSDTFWQRAISFLLAIQCKLRLIDNGKYKEKVLERIWSTRTATEQFTLLNDFLEFLSSLVNELVMKQLQQHLNNNDTVVIISASPDFYVKPFFSNVSEKIEVHASDVCLNGSIVSVNNLYGKAKTRIAKIIIAQHDPGYIKVYTDHDSDFPLIELANEAILVRPSKHLVSCVRKLQIPFKVINS